MESNQRLHPRLALDVRVNFDYDAIAHAQDISEGGICLITESALTADRILRLSFTLPGRPSSIECFGKVMWTKLATEHLHQSGIGFWEIQDPDRAEVQAFLIG